jgi:hypothetical protein
MGTSLHLRMFLNAAAVISFHVLVTCIILFDVFAGTRTFVFNHDATVQTFPWLTKIFDAVRHGEIALWSFGTAGGESFIGELQTGALYPLSLLAGLVLMPGDPYGIDLFIAMHFLIGALALHALARGLGLDHVSSAIGGIAFAFASAVGLRATGQPNLFAGLVYIPIVVLGAIKATDSATTLGAVAWTSGGGVALALSLLAGHLYATVDGVAAACVTLIALRPPEIIPIAIA